MSSFFNNFQRMKFSFGLSLDTDEKQEETTERSGRSSLSNYDNSGTKEEKEFSIEPISSKSDLSATPGTGENNRAVRFLFNEDEYEETEDEGLDEADAFHGTLQFIVNEHFLKVNDIGMCSDRDPDGISPIANNKFQRKVRMKERLVVLSKLGAGASATVYKALDLQTMSIVAVKRIKIFDKEKKQQMISELQAWYRILRDSSPQKNNRITPYVVEFYDAFSTPEDSTVSFMLEYMGGGSLQRLVDEGGVKDESTLAKIAMQLLLGLRFLHESGQLHRDLKPANFLISDRGVVKISDLGLMKELEEDVDAHQRKRSSTYLGTASYMSPERLNGEEYDFPADIWSFGVTMMTLALGKLPFDTSRGYWKMLDCIRDAPMPKLPEIFSPDFQDFLDKCLVKEPEQRWGSEGLMSHPFLAELKNKDLFIDVSRSKDEQKNRKELQSILKTTYYHIDLLKGTSMSSHPLFGDMRSYESHQIVERFLMGNLVTENEPEKKGQPRLEKLAKQLNLDLPSAMTECENLLKSINPN